MHKPPTNDQATISGQRRYFVPFNERYILHPGRFVLGITLEWMRLLEKIAAYVTGKSSWGRRGLIIETAAGIYPGFSGCLALELANVGELPIALRPGMPICQIFLHETSVGKTASSAFDGRRRPVLGVIRKDKVLARLSAGDNAPAQPCQLKIKQTVFARSFQARPQETREAQDRLPTDAVSCWPCEESLLR